MDDPEIKKLLGLRSSAKGVFTRHSNCLQRVILDTDEVAVQQYPPAREKVIVSKEKFDEIHDELVAVLVTKEQCPLELEEDAVELDTRFTRLLTEVAAWKKGIEAGHEKSKSQLEETIQAKLAEQEETHVREKQELNEKIENLCKDLDRLKVLAEVAGRSSSTPADTNRRVTFGLPDTFNQGPADAGGSFLRKDVDGFPGDRDYRLPLGRGRARPRLGRDDTSVGYDRRGSAVHSGTFGDISDFQLQQQQLLYTSVMAQRSMVASMNAPTVKLTTFKGDPLSYMEFTQSYNDLVYDVLENDRAKLSVLISHCEGKALSVVQPFRHKPATEGLEGALAELKKKFGTAYIISQAWLEKILRYPVLNTSELIERFAFDLEACKNSLQALGKLAEIECTNSMQVIVAKLPQHLRQRWRKIHRKNLEEEGESVLDLLVKLVREAADDEMDPAYSETSIARVRGLYDKVIPGNRPIKGLGAGFQKRATVNMVQDEWSESVSESGSCSDDGLEGEVYALARNHPTCASCGSSHHFTSRCRSYKDLKPVDRLRFVRTKRLCILCLSAGHDREACPLPWKCQDKTCGGKHHTSLHNAFVSSSDAQKDVAVPGANVPAAAVHQVQHDGVEELEMSSGVFLTMSSPCLPLTPVTLKYGNRSVKSYALLDTGSTLTLCNRRVFDQLMPESLGRGAVRVNTVTDKKMMEGDFINLEIASEDGHETHPVFRALTVDKLPVTLDHLARGSSIANWPHLKDLEIPLGSAEQVDILIGQNNAHLLEQFDKVKGGAYEPYAVLTKLGWTVFGNVNEAPGEDETVNLTLGTDVIPDPIFEDLEKFMKVEEVPVVLTEGPSECGSCVSAYTHAVDELGLPDMEFADDCIMDSELTGEPIYVTTQAQERELIPEQIVENLQKFWDSEEVPSADVLSAEDRYVLDLWDREFRVVDGYPQLPIPLKPGYDELPDNYFTAVKSLKNLGRRFIKNKEECSQYRTAILKDFDLNHAEVVPPEQIKKKGKVWYLLHHGVDHPRKPGVIRPVANGAAKYLGISLNTIAYKGPDLMNGLVEVLTKFRQFAFGSTADIEGMFKQLRVPPDQRDLLRFVFWIDGDPTKGIMICRMTCHIFGTVWAPAAANYALKRIARDAAPTVPPEVVKSIEEEFYVDDWLNGETSEERSEKMVKDVREVVRAGHFNLTKVASNSRQVLLSVEMKDRAKELARVDLNSDVLPRGVTLGQSWDAESDRFGFSSNPEPRPFTRRGMMSTVASLYDPLGLLAPFILPAKLLMREICQAGSAWDEPLPPKIAPQWERWIEELPRVEQFEVKRWLGCTRETINTLHHFGDACQRSYGAVSFLAVREGNEQKARSLIVSGKSKLAPTRVRTIPKLELSASTLAVKMELALVGCFSVELQESQFYSDSDIVLKMLLHDPAEFDTFSRNRVAFIQEHTKVHQWHFIPGTENPADLVSRGTRLSELVGNDLWLHGPEVIREVVQGCVGRCEIGDLPEDFSEFRKAKPVCAVETRAMKRKMDDEKREVMPKQMRIEKSEEFKVKAGSKRRLKEDTQQMMHQVKRAQIEKSEKEEEVSERVRNETSKRKMSEEVESVQRKRCCGEGVGESGRETKVNVVDVYEILRRYSGLCPTVRAVAWILRTMDCLKSGMWRVGELGVNELRRAERTVLLLTQRKYLTHDMRRVPAFKKLDPKLEDDLWVVGGRLQYSSFADEIKHPAIVPEGSPLAAQLIQEAHVEMGHCGVDRTLYEIRDGFWMLGGLREVRRVIGECVLCRRLKGKPESQKMAPLPDFRLAVGFPPFFKTGVDLFGPLFVTLGRATVKRYGVLFTCLTCRAVHLEVAQDLTTSSFLCVLENFTARRGKPDELRSDNGTNFVGARNTLPLVKQLVGDEKLYRKLAEKAIKWTHNTPAGSHQGGAWERLIRTARGLMMTLLGEHRVTEAKLMTVFCMIEGIMNGRPLTRLSTDADSLEPLTPGHLLHINSLGPLFPERFTADGLRRDWRQTQFLAGAFWDMWMKKYLPGLQKRVKWNEEKTNITKGELVVILQENTPRSCWPLAVVKDVHPGGDGKVRNVTLKTAGGELRRPVQKIVRLEADCG